MDPLQVLVIGALVAIGIASTLIFWRIVSSGISTSIENTESEGPGLLVTAIGIVLFFPIILICCIGSWWLLTTGWVGIENTLMISTEGGLAFGIIMAGFIYVFGVVGRRSQRKMEADMKKIEKTKRPVPAKYGAKVAVAIPALVLVTILFNLLMSNFTINTLAWQRVFPYEALYWLILGLIPFIPNSRFEFSIHDPGAKWWLITLITVAGIIASLSVLLAYFF